MKILTAEQIRALDKFTIENEPISSFDLMERAALAALQALPRGPKLANTPVYYICGKGNNGGDGLAMARIQAEKEDREITVVILEHMEQGTTDFGKNLYHLQGEESVEIIHVRSIKDFPPIPEEALVIDAILGSGITRPLDGLLADVVQRLNSTQNQIISVDMPTGLFAEDNSGNDLSKVVYADATATFHCPKLSLLLPDTGAFAGELFVQDIGLLEQEMQIHSPYRFVLETDLMPLILKREKFGHKGNYGHALLVAGSRGKMGAAELASGACLRSGAGLLTAHVPACGVDIMQVGVREAMCSIDAEEHFISTLPKLDKFQAIGFGPGVGTENATADTLKVLIQEARVPMVIDADGLNILSENKTWLSFLRPDTILTPHPKEFERLVGGWKSDYERLHKQIEFSTKYGVIVVLKGAHTSVSMPDGGVYFNSTGNPGLSKAGTGDLLTGIILGLLAQGYPPEVASVLGVFVHGSAGDGALMFQATNTVLASDLLIQIGPVFMALNGETKFLDFMSMGDPGDDDDIT